MKENNIQENFDAVHSFFTRKLCDDKTNYLEGCKNLFELIAAYNRLCKAYGMPIKHSITI